MSTRALANLHCVTCNCVCLHKYETCVTCKTARPGAYVTISREPGALTIKSARYNKAVERMAAARRGRRARRAAQLAGTL